MRAQGDEQLVLEQAATVSQFDAGAPPQKRPQSANRGDLNFTRASETILS